MDLYLISYGNPRDTRGERTYLADGGDGAILVRANDRLEALDIASRTLTVVAPCVLEAHLVARMLE